MPQAEIFAKVQQGIASGTVEFDVLEGGAPWEGDILGKGLASEMPDWVKTQIELDDYVGYLQAPVGTWDGKTYRISIDGDCHNFNYRSDVFANEDLAAEWSSAGMAEPWGVPTTWQRVQEVTKFLAGKEIDGENLYGILDVCKPGGGFSWYFFASRATAYAKHPDDKAWLFDAETMKPRINNPAFARALEDVIAALPTEPADQLNADLLNTLGQFLAGQGSMAHWWGDVGSNVYTNDQSVVQDKVAFSILPGSPDVYNSTAGAWDTFEGNNYAPNMAYIGWGLYVMQASVDRSVNEAAWDVAAHLGGKDLSLWTAIYPSGFQPYRTSHFNIEEWESDRTAARVHRRATSTPSRTPTTTRMPPSSRASRASSSTTSPPSRRSPRRWPVRSPPRRRSTRPRRPGSRSPTKSAARARSRSTRPRSGNRRSSSPPLGRFNWGAGCGAPPQSCQASDRCRQASNELRR